ncbi:MAG: hypothetical protein KGK07_10090 [Chloroflexota bacterium]|nr:hypothetical protein [Chloroflexota bacterium]
MSPRGITFTGSIPLACLGASGAAVAFGLPAVMTASAPASLAFSVWILRVAGGGIAQVVRDSSVEYEAVIAGGG